jgi:hypothetical protein
LVDQLGERYEIVPPSIKKWTVGSPIQGPLDALEIILKRRPFEADQVKEVVVRMAPGSVVDNREMPDVCIQHMLAVMLIDKTATFRAAHDKPRMQPQPAAPSSQGPARSWRAGDASSAGSRHACRRNALERGCDRGTGHRE